MISQNYSEKQNISLVTCLNHSWAQLQKTHPKMLSIYKYKQRKYVRWTRERERVEKFTFNYLKWIHSCSCQMEIKSACWIFLIEFVWCNRCDINNCREHARASARKREREREVIKTYWINYNNMHVWFAVHQFNITHPIALSLSFRMYEWMLSFSYRVTQLVH